MTPTDRTQVRRRFDVTADAALPALAGILGAVDVATVEEQLEASYFDTAELDLARSLITLRCRIGGEDAGWHLTLPAKAARAETSAPLGRSATSVPKRLRTTVLAITRDRSLSVVAIVRTHRTVHRLLNNDGQVIAAIVDDHVTGSDSHLATSRAWREWQIKPVGTTAEMLEDIARLLRQNGAKPSPWPSKLARTLNGRLVPSAPPKSAPSGKSQARDVIQARIVDLFEQLRTLDPLVRLDAPEALHDIRVAIRRLRAALASYGPFLNPEVTEPLRLELRWLGGAFSSARDAEVLHSRLRRMLIKEAPIVVRGDADSRVDRALRAEYRQARAHLIQTLETDRYLTLLDELAALVESPPWSVRADKPARSVLRSRLRHDWARLQARVARAARATEPTERARRLHEVRKATKRVRYSAETLVPVYGKDARRLAKAAKRLQAILGDHHDSVVSREWLQRFAAEAAGDGPISFTLGALHAREEVAAAETESRYELCWRRVHHGKALHLLS